jgi:hypothetical protein
MPASRSEKNVPIYQLLVTLVESQPPIWRRVQVPGDISLAKLHEILQIAMGWSNSHLHQFVVDGISYSAPDPELDELEGRDERTTRLDQVATSAEDHFVYEYDFGDNWEHDIVVEAILPAEPGIFYPVCTAGERACPPEDCGGIWGYEEMLEAVQDPDHPEHDEMIEWLSQEFDPEVVDLDGINQELRKVR